MSRFSEDLPSLGSLPERVERIRADLARALGRSPGAPRQWEDRVVFPIEVSVDLPSRGPVDGLDIREDEPLLLAFETTRYPRVPPAVFSDRRDFPAQRLPHIESVRADAVAQLCLHRGDMIEWFAEHDLTALVARARAWLRDAAAGRLQPPSDQFEPTRAPRGGGLIVFDSARLVQAVEGGWQQTGGAAGHADLAVLTSASTPPTAYVFGVFAGLLEEHEVARMLNEERAEPEARTSSPSVGVLVWPPQVPLGTYFRLPTTRSELVDFARSIDAPLATVLDRHQQLVAGQPHPDFVVVVLAVPRPRRLVNQDSSIEFVALGLPVRATDASPVTHLLHLQPLTRSLARDVALLRDGGRRIAVLGCGALGSKISLHYARSGSTDQVLVDKSQLLPHNQVRHGLLSGYVGENKARALGEEIRRLYSFDTAPGPTAHPVDVHEFLADATRLEGVGLLIDSSASMAVLNSLCDADLAPECRVVRCEIASLGLLGLCSYEGSHRNPRLDDLHAQILHMAVRDDAVSAWLRHHREVVQARPGGVLEEIQLGTSCSSETMRVSDALVSLHASQFAARLQSCEDTPQAGAITLVTVRTDPCFSSETRTVSVDPVEVLPCVNAPGWTTRLGGGAARFIRARLRGAKGRETGGILVGYVNRKRKIVYVVDALPPSTDSYAGADRFELGVAGYEEKIRAIQERTGGLLGYMGDWHTHPSGSPSPSATDTRTARRLAALLAHAGLPMHVLIASPRGMSSSLYGLDQVTS